MARGNNRGRGASSASQGGAQGQQGFGHGRRGRHGEGLRHGKPFDAELDHEVEAITRSLSLAQVSQSHNGLPQAGSFFRGGRPLRSNRANGFIHAYNSPRGSAHSRGRGIGFPNHTRGRGNNFALPYGRGGSASRTPTRDRPMLKPVTFVKSTILFRDHNEIFKSNAPDHEDDDAPTAEKVEGLFSRGFDSLEAQTSANQIDGEAGQARFTEFSVNELFAETEEIPVLCWGFSAAELLSSGSQAPRPLDARLSTRQDANPQTTLNTPTTTIRETVMISALSHSDPLRPQSTSRGPRLDIQELFRMSAAEAQAVTTSADFATLSSTSATPAPTTISAPQTNPLPEPAGARDAISSFFIDTEGDNPEIVSPSLRGSSREDVMGAQLEKVAQEQTASFSIDVVGDSLFPEGSRSLTNIRPKHDKGIKHYMPEYAGFVIDTEGDNVNASEQKVAPKSNIRYSMYRPEGEGGALGGGPPLDQMQRAPEYEDDGEDVVVFIPPTAGPPKPRSSGPTIPFAEFDLSQDMLGKAEGGKTLLISRQAHTGMHKKHKKMAKRQRRKERQKNDRELQRRVLYGLAPGPDGGASDGQARVGGSDLEQGLTGPPEASSASCAPALSKPKGKRHVNARVDASARGHGTMYLEDHGMDIDPDLQLEDVEYEQMMMRIMKESNQTTIDDLADAARIQAEDASDSDGELGSSGDSRLESDVANDVIANQEELLDVGSLVLNSVEDDYSDGSSSKSSGTSEETSFQTKLRNVRARSKELSMSAAGAFQSSSEDSDDYPEVFGVDRSWAQRDEEAIDEIQALIDSDLATMSRGNRKKLLKSVHTGEFQDDIILRNSHAAAGTSRKMKKVGGYIPDELRNVWKHDRAKKKEYKKARAEKRRLAALDPFPKPKRLKNEPKGGVDVPHAKPAIAFISSDIDDEASDASSIPSTPARAVNILTLEPQIRRFIADIGRQTMVLPPMEKESRRRVHLLAQAFNLNSKSVGKGDKRHTTLNRTTRTGINIQEGRIAALVRGKFGSATFGTAFDQRGGEGSGRTPFVRTREGDVVGHKAAKISKENVGFKLLQRMGWNDGERIGVTGGLAVPLTAVIKNTKRGLGA